MSKFQGELVTRIMQLTRKFIWFSDMQNKIMKSLQEMKFLITISRIMIKLIFEDSGRCICVWKLISSNFSEEITLTHINHKKQYIYYTKKISRLHQEYQVKRFSESRIGPRHLYFYITPWWSLSVSPFKNPWP